MSRPDPERPPRRGPAPQPGRAAGSAPAADIEEAAGAESAAPAAPWRDFLRRFARQRAALMAGAFLLALLLAAAAAPWIVPFDPSADFDYDRINALPSASHWMGVDAFGRDIFSRVLMGARVSLAVGLASVALGAAIGAALGLAAGWRGGWVDRIVMRACDVLFAFPGLLLAIGIVAVLGAGLANVVLAVAVFSVPTFARLVRASTLALKQQAFVDAARAIGASDADIVWRHVLPGAASTIVVYFTLRIGTAIITAASLSFLGLGAQPPTPEWGAMLNEARADMVTAPHVALFPSLAIFMTVLAFNLLGDGLRDALDPKLDA